MGIIDLTYVPNKSAFRRRRNSAKKFDIFDNYTQTDLSTWQKEVSKWQNAIAKANRAIAQWNSELASGSLNKRQRGFRDDSIRSKRAGISFANTKLNTAKSKVQEIQADLKRQADEEGKRVGETKESQEKAREATAKADTQEAIEAYVKTKNYLMYAVIGVSIIVGIVLLIKIIKK